MNKVKPRRCPDLLLAFGRDLRDWLLQDPDGLKAFYMMDDSTWELGGCWPLAEALYQWIGRGSERWAVWGEWAPGPGYIPGHIVVKIGNCFLDGTGVSSKAELLARWMQRAPGIPYLAPVSPKSARRAAVWCDRHLVGQLVEALERTFGPGENVLQLAS